MKSVIQKEIEMESAHNKYIINKLAYSAAGSGEGLTKTNMALAKIGILVLVLVFLLLILEKQYLVAAIFAFINIFFAQKFFWLKTENFAYLFTLGFTVYFIWAQDYWALILLIIYIGLNAINVRTQAKNIKKMWLQKANNEKE
ncbi:MAG TPA: hypothetical protein ENI57_09430 [Ignavibacteria bacterium]|nr:hypothetical protein [Ignavibacteria bacterium]